MTGAEDTTVRVLLEGGERSLGEAGVAESVADARLLLAHALGASPTWLFAHGQAPVAGEAARAFSALIERRCRREPLQHILGVQEFWSLPLEVGPDVLVPRPETELLVETALAHLQAIERPKVADVGTGSGAVALALASELPRARVVATDVSEAALAVAARNATRLGLDARLAFASGPLAAPLAPHAPFDAIVANLPYVSRAEWERLEPEVRDHEPEAALVGGEEGTELILELVGQAPEVMAPDGLLALEVGWTQAGVVRAALERGGWRDVATRRDFAGIERVVLGLRPA